MFSEAGSRELTRRIIREQLAELFGEADVEANKDLVKRIIGESTETVANPGEKLAWSDAEMRRQLQRILDGSETTSKKQVREKMKEIFDEQEVESNRDSINEALSELTDKAA